MVRCFIASYGKDQKKGVYSVDMNESGKLSLVHHLETDDYPSYIICDDHYLYASMKNARLTNDGGGVCIFQLNEESIPELYDVYAHGRSYTHLCLSPDKTRLFVANYHMGTTAAYLLDNHKIKEKTSVVHHVGNGPDPLKRQESPHVHNVGITPDEKYVYAVDLGADEVVLYDYEEGKLLENWKHKVVEGSGPRHMIFSKDGLYAYLVNEIANTIMVFRYRQGRFAMIQMINTTPRHYTGDNSAAAIRMNDAETHLFVSNRGHDSIAMYGRNSETGKLYLCYMVHTAAGPRDFNIVDEHHLVVACEKDDCLEVLHFDASKDLLEKTGERIAVPAPVCVAF